MKTLFVLLIIIFPLCAGNPCRDITTNTDPFSDTVVKEGEYIFLDFLHRIKFKKENDDVSLIIDMLENGEVEKNLPANSIIKLALTNGEIIEFTVPTDINPVTDVRNYELVTAWNITFPISDDQLVILNDNYIKAILSPNIAEGGSKSVEISECRVARRTYTNQVEVMMCSDCCTE